MRNSLRRLVVVLAVSVLAAACGSSSPKAAKPHPPVDQGPKLIGKGARPAPPSLAVLRAAASGEERFAVELYRELAPAPGNVAIAPSSITTVLGMIEAGARGKTAQQMVEALHVPLPASELHAAIGGLAQTFANRSGPGVTLTEVDQAWLQQDRSVLGPYADTLSKLYGAPLAVIDFAHAAAAAATINAWFDQLTHGKITELLDASDLDAQTALVLTDAVYLAADWKLAFDPKLTKPAPFHLGAGSSVNVPTMSYGDDHRFAYGAGTGWREVVLPYKGNELEMDVIVPDDLGAFESTLNAARLASILRDVHPEYVVLSMPRFESRVQSDLVPPLQKLGITDAFSPYAADLSGIDGRQDLFVSAVKHEVVVHVDEKGTVAAGATAGIAELSAGHQTTVLTVDKPFVYVVRDRATGAILFLGRVSDPRS